MKRFKQLYGGICAFDNLLRAYYKARKGKRNNDNVAAFEVNLEYELLQLEKELQEQTYHPGTYRTFMIYDPKKRMISAAPFRDRVVHHALCNVIEPLLDKSLIFDTYANRKGKGTHAAIRRCQSYIRRFPYAMKADIRKYFPSIDHTILKKLIEHRIGCPPTLDLIFKVIDNSNRQEAVNDYFPEDDLFSIVRRRKGLPMGNLTSQFFANFYLNPFDHFVKETLRIPGYVRYVDDFILFGRNKVELQKAGREVSFFLAEQLRLYLNERKSFVIPTASGISFLGQRIFSTHRLLRKANVRRFRKRLRKRLRKLNANQLSPGKFEAQLNAWLGHAQQADTWQLREAVYRDLWFHREVPVAKRENGSWCVF